MLPLIILTINLLNTINHAFSQVTFSAPLIHRSSPDSPFYSANYNREKHIQDGVDNTRARIQYFSQLREVPKGYVAAPLLGWNMLMKYAIGTPPVTSYGVFDTGSSFTWVQCLPCVHCYKQGKYSFFDPNSSGSFQVVLCNDPHCSMAPGHTCRSSQPNDLCTYNATYTDTSTSSHGVLSTETITLSSDNTTQTIPHLIFGCGHNNHNNQKIPGIVGVGNGSLSLIQQLSISYFSQYIIANSTHIEGTAHFGLVGSGPSISMPVFDTGMTTPLLPTQLGLYSLDLIGINIDGFNLDLPSGIFKSTDEISASFIVDSGTTYTTLHTEAFDMLITGIMRVMNTHVPESTKHFELCYKDVNDAPEVVFQFSGLEFVICDANLWTRHKGLYCLAMIRLKENEGNVSVFGFYQQRNVEAGFDLRNNLLSLVYPQGCPPDAVDFLEP